MASLCALFEELNCLNGPLDSTNARVNGGASVDLNNSETIINMPKSSHNFLHWPGSVDDYFECRVILRSERSS